jgi:hypothetical protein
VCNRGSGCNRANQEPPSSDSDRAAPGKETVILQKMPASPCYPFANQPAPCCSPRSPSDTTTQSDTDGGRASGGERVVRGDCRLVSGRISGNGSDDHIPGDGRNAGGERGSSAGRDLSCGGGHSSNCVPDSSIRHIAGGAQTVWY